MIGENIMDEYILFVDESGVTPDNPYFCLGGFAVKRSEYEEHIVNDLFELKKKYEIDYSVPLHYTEIKNGKGSFKKFKEDKQLRTNFMTDLIDIIKKSNMHTFGVYANVETLEKIIHKKSTPVYNVLFSFMLDQYLCFLKERNGSGLISVESRTFCENSSLQDVYYNRIRFGSDLFNADLFKKYMANISFTIKGDVCAGLQIADFIPVAFLRKINERTDNYNLTQTVLSKLYKNNDDVLKNYLGFKNYL